MAIAAYVLFWIAAATAVVQLLFVWWFCRLLRRRPRPTADAAPPPKTAILLPLRGADPHLADTLRKLLRQEHPDYEVLAIVDASTDPALAVVEQVADETGARNLRTALIREKRATCSPQCSALIQGVESLAPDVEVVAVVDGDVQTHPTWLRELIAPLAQPHVAATFGNRWFLPLDAGWGSIVRYLWIAASVVPMYLLGIPWAGTFALKRRFLEDSGLAAAWSQTIVPDAPTMKYLHEHGLAIRFVPSLMMINRERCSLAFAHDFLKRQLMWTRLYHARFWPVVVHAAATVVVWLATPAVIVVGLATGNYAAAAYAGGALILFWAATLASLAAMEFAVREVARRRGQTDLAVAPGFLRRLPFGIWVTLAVHASAVLLAMVRNRVTWRGVTYLVRRPYDVVIETDSPPTADIRPAEANVSL